MPKRIQLMNEKTARKILGKSIRRDDALMKKRRNSNDAFVEYIVWLGQPDKYISICGNFTVDYIEAVAWWMRNKSKN